MDDVTDEALDWAIEQAEDRAQFLSSDPEAEDTVRRLQRRALALRKLRQSVLRVEELAEAWEKHYSKAMFPQAPMPPGSGRKLVWVDVETGERLSKPFAMDRISAAMGRACAWALRREMEGRDDFTPRL